MKTKVLGLIGLSTIIALSFAFSPATRAEKKISKEKERAKEKEPIGGLISEDKF